MVVKRTEQRWQAKQAHEAELLLAAQVTSLPLSHHPPTTHLPPHMPHSRVCVPCKRHEGQEGRGREVVRGVLQSSSLQCETRGMHGVQKHALPSFLLLPSVPFFLLPPPSSSHAVKNACFPPVAAKMCASLPPEEEASHPPPSERMRCL